MLRTLHYSITSYLCERHSFTNMQVNHINYNLHINFTKDNN